MREYFKQQRDALARTSLREEIIPDQMKASELVKQITQQIMSRKGEVIDHDLATERARNIAAGLVGLTII